MGLPTPSGPLGTAVTWISGLFKNHEWLLAVIIGAALVWGVSGKVQNIIAAHDQKFLDSSTATLQAQVDKNAALAQSNAQLAADFKSFAAQAQAANQQLEVANAKLADALKQRQAVDANLPPTDLAARIEALIKLPDGSVAPAPGNMFSLTFPAAVSIAQNLEAIPSFQQQISNVQTEKANAEQELAKESLLVTGLNNQVDGLKLQIGDATKVCQAQVKVVKDAAAKSKRKWFVIGFVAGFATRVLTTH